MLIANYKVGTRLAASYTLIILLLIATAACGAWVMSDIRGRFAVAGENDEQIAAAHALSVQVSVLGGIVREYVLDDDAGRRARARKRIDEARQGYDAIIKTLLGFGHEADRKVVELIDTRGKAVFPLYARALELADADAPALAAKTLREQVQPAQDAWTREIETMITQQAQENHEGVEEATAASTKAIRLLAGLALAAVAASVLLGWLVTRSVTRPLAQAADVAVRVSEGDLTVEVEVVGRDEPAQLLQALQRMTVQLRAVVDDVRQGVESVSTASQQIAAGSHDLSARTEQQASSLQQTAAGMEELTGTVKLNADNARQANTLAADASSAADRGGAVVGQVVATMEEISASSRKIEEIIAVIDGIAFQTNILALNAAVEAARAGEQGRGFAVVAGEVRSLAQRAGQAAHEIKNLIGESVQRVDAGGAQVHQAGAAMQDIVAQVKRVTGLIGEIANSNLQQSTGIDEMNTAIVQMDTVTQQNAALVEESAAAAESLKDQARRLAEAVHVFKLPQGAAA